MLFYFSLEDLVLSFNAFTTIYDGLTFSRLIKLRYEWFWWFHFLEELERVKSELEDAGRKKDGEISNLNAKLEAEQDLVAQLQKKIKELQARIAELEDELESERSGRVKAEKRVKELQHELDDLSQRLDEAGGATQARIIPPSLYSVKMYSKKLD